MTRRPPLIALALAALTLAAYAPAVRYGFVNYDDAGYVYENDHVRRGLTGDGLAWAFTSVEQANWHPLTWLSHMLDAEVYGVGGTAGPGLVGRLGLAGLGGPGGHHLTSLLLHVAGTLVLFRLLRRMTGADGRSAVVAALFALHPLHVESVAWVAERKDVLAALLGLMSMAAYVRYAERPGVGRYAAVFILLALGLMAKPMLVTLPLVFLLLDYWPLGRVRWGQGRY